MLLFFAVHVVRLVWLTRVCITQKTFRLRRNAIAGKKTRKRLQRCAPGQWQRMERHQLRLYRVLSFVCAGLQSSSCIGVLYHAMNWTVDLLTSVWCSVRFWQCCVVLGAWLVHATFIVKIYVCAKCCPACVIFLLVGSLRICMHWQ